MDPVKREESEGSGDEAEIEWDFAASLEDELLEKTVEDCSDVKATNANETSARSSEKRPAESGSPSLRESESPRERKRLKTIGKVRSSSFSQPFNTSLMNTYRMVGGFIIEMRGLSKP
eukprot:41294-Prorocentrum_minimum.AAC.3